MERRHDSYLDGVYILAIVLVAWIIYKVVWYCLRKLLWCCVGKLCRVAMCLSSGVKASLARSNQKITNLATSPPLPDSQFKEDALVVVLAERLAETQAQRDRWREAAQASEVSQVVFWPRWKS